MRGARRLCSYAADREQDWAETCAAAVTAVRGYIRTRGLRALQDRLSGNSPWPAVADSDDPDTEPVIEPVSDDNGYIGRRSQESLLAGGNASEDARHREVG